MSTISDAKRHRLHNAIEGLIGEENANTMFELLPPVGWADVARQSDIVALKSDIAHLERRIDQLDARMATKEELAAVEARLEAKLERGLREQYNRFLFTVIGVVGLMTALQTMLDRILG